MWLAILLEENRKLHLEEMYTSKRDLEFDASQPVQKLFYLSICEQGLLTNIPQS
jgi:hypothetical protein